VNLIRRLTSAKLPSRAALALAVGACFLSGCKTFEEVIVKPAVDGFRAGLEREAGRAPSQAANAAPARAPQPTAADQPLVVKGGAPRFKPQDRAVRENLRMRNQGISDSELGWRLAESGGPYVYQDEFVRTRIEFARCIYRSGDKSPNVRFEVREHVLTFWRGDRPELPPGSLARLNGGLDISFDVAVNRCPDTYGDAIRAGLGPNAWDIVKAMSQGNIQQLSAEREAQKLRAEEQARREAAAAEQAERAWMEAAVKAGALPADQERALLKDVQSQIAAFESQRQNLFVRPFADAVQGDLGNKLDRLAQSAVARVTPINAKTTPGRQQFDRWDREIGGPVLLAARRLDLFVHDQVNRRYTLAEIQNERESSFRRNMWSQVDLAKIWRVQNRLLGVFDAKLAGTHTASPAFLKRAADQLAKDRPSGDPGRPLYIYQPPERKPGWAMSPAEQAAQLPFQGAANTVADLLGLVGNLLRAIDKVDADIVESRRRFWACHDQSCADAGKALYAYSHAQLAKDYFYFVRPFAMSAVMAPGMGVAGADNIDGGLIPACGQQRSALQSELDAAARLAQAGQSAQATKTVSTVMSGPAYAAWQSCRDRYEYFLRPR
jgi:hypothetical protein